MFIKKEKGLLNDEWHIAKAKLKHCEAQYTRTANSEESVEISFVMN